MRHVLGLLAVLAVAPVSLAAPIAITNAGFEADPVPNGAFLVLEPTGWDPYDPGTILNGNTYAIGVIRPQLGHPYFPAGAPQGVNAALVYLAGTDETDEAGIEQDLGVNVQAYTTYTLTVQIGNIDSGVSAAGSSDGGGVNYNLKGFPGYRIELLANGVAFASDSTSAGVPGEGLFTLATLAFSTGGANPQIGQELGVRLVNLKAPGTVSVPNIEVDFDDVQLDASPAPEPASAAMLAVGAMLLTRSRRR